MSVPYTRADRLSAVSSGSVAAGPSPERVRLQKEVIHLFDRYRKPLLQYLSSFGVACHYGEEIVQEVFLLLLRHMEQGKSRQNLPGWIFRVAHNLGCNELDLARRHSSAWAEHNSGELLIDRNPNPEEALMQDQSQKHLLSVVKCLAEQDRRCLLLRAEGLNYRQIAEILAISLGSVSASLARSLARMTRAATRYGQP